MVFKNKEKFRDLKRKRISHISLNIGLLCNQACQHCHLDAGPDRKESMDLSMVEKLKEFIGNVTPDSIEVTGGAPEMHPDIEFLLNELKPLAKNISMRTNLTALLDKGKEFIDILHKNNIILVASLPCYRENIVDSQRGEGVFNKSIESIKMLNSAGYGLKTGPQLVLVYNPPEFQLPPPQKDIEKEFKKVLFSKFGINFSSLVAMANVPVGRFAEYLRKNKKDDSYFYSLESNFNGSNLERVMCLSQVTIDWNGRFYDCDFNLAIDLPSGGWSNIDSYLHSRQSLGTFIGSRIFTGPHCLACTAGAGSSCHGSLDDSK